jgi:cytochrome c oxidase subunit 1
VLGFGYLFPMVYLAWAWRHGKIAGNNPFHAKGLEWETTSPPPTFNFDRVPIVTEATHSYGHQETKVA